MPRTRCAMGCQSTSDHRRNCPIDKHTDRKKRHVEHDDVVACQNCDALYPRAEDACPECGEPRTRHSKVVVLDGQLVPVEWDAGEPEPEGATVAEIQQFYCEMLAACAANGWKSGAAFFKTCERYRMEPDFNDPVTGRVLAYEWRQRHASAVDPTPETLRWVTNQQKHYFARTRSRRKEGNMNGCPSISPGTCRSMRNQCPSICSIGIGSSSRFFRGVVGISAAPEAANTCQSICVPSA